MSRSCAALAALFLVGLANAQDHSSHTTAPANTDVSRHIPPDPPTHTMRDMSAHEMIELMDMDDDASVAMLKADEFEWRDTNSGDVFAWDLQAWYGNDYGKALFKTEGDTSEEDTGARLELLWDRVISRWWSLQAGTRHDINPGPARTWAAVGVQGLAPYWFEVEATAYVGEEGRSALRVAIDYELLLTQRLVFEPAIEIEAYGKNDRENLIGSGIANTELALRLSYEIKRELAPYVGLVWSRSHGNTAEIAKAASVDTDEVQFVAGLRWWL
jgi:copper resistance protein B